MVPALLAQVPRDADRYHDDPRIHRGFGRLFIEEFRRRTAENAARAALADSSSEG
jgi:hypothetical protein